MITKIECTSQEEEFRELIATNASSSLLLLLINRDSSCVYVRSWTVMIRKLFACSLPIARLTLRDFKMDEETMHFFGSVNPLCFSSTVITLDNVDFSAVPNSFPGLFDRFLKPKAAQLRGIQGVQRCSLSQSLSNILSLPSVECLHLLGLVHPAAGFKIEFIDVFQFLQSNDLVGRKEVFLDFFCLELELEEIWHQLYQVFIADTRKCSYKLAIRCPQGVTLPKERRSKNAQTEELLSLQLHHPSWNFSSMNQHDTIRENFAVFLRLPFSPAKNQLD